MDEWMKNYPSVFVNRSYKGDKDYAKLFYGEGNKLLYQLKNLMAFRNLGQLKMTRLFTDGTVLRAKSVFGQDTIEIDVSESIFAEAAKREYTCMITFADFPLYVQPMRYPNEIHEGEVKDKDYLKIYYTVEDSNCENCSGIKWDVLIKECIYSIENYCWGQVIESESGNDEGGRYIIVKLFTEFTTYPRVGYSKMNLKGWIDKPDGTEACKAEKEIMIDCCLKDKSLRLVVMRWDEGCEACEVPEENLVTDIDSNTPFYAMPQWDGGCIPYSWGLAGVGSIEVTDPKLGRSIIYHPSEEPMCDEDVWLYLYDRCGTVDSAHFKSCCQEAATLEIGYTTLSMQCNQQQSLGAYGGCAPYHWSLSGGGSLSATEGQQITYTAPSSNAGCAFNATITLTDCCGGSAHIQIAVNCYTTSADAYVLWSYNVTYSAANCGAACGYGNGPLYWWTLTGYVYNCDGTLRRTCTMAQFTRSPDSPPGYSNFVYCNYGGGNIYACSSTGWHLATDGVKGDNCGCLDPTNQGCGTWLNNAIWNTCVPTPASTCMPGDGDIWDVRTPAQIAAGCCPLNPNTGLPF